MKEVAVQYRIRIAFSHAPSSYATRLCDPDAICIVYCNIVSAAVDCKLIQHCINCKRQYQTAIIWFFVRRVNANKITEADKELIHFYLFIWKVFAQNKHREKVHATAKTQMTLLHAKGGQRKLKNRIGTQRNSSVVYALALVAVFQTCKKIGKSYFRWWLEMLLLLLLLLSWAEFFDQYPLGIGILYQIVRKFSRHSVISSTVLKHC